MRDFLLHSRFGAKRASLSGVTKQNFKKRLLDLAGEILKSPILTAAQKKKLAALMKNKSVRDLDDFICKNGEKVYQRLMALLPKIPGK